MDTALPQKFPFILDRNLAKANCTENYICSSCDIIIILFKNYYYYYISVLFPGDLDMYYWCLNSTEYKDDMLNCPIYTEEGCSTLGDYADTPLYNSYNVTTCEFGLENSSQVPTARLSLLFGGKNPGLVWKQASTLFL